MKEYHKIEAVFKRDEQTKKVIEQYRNPTVEFLKDNIWQFTEKVDGCVHSKTLINMADGSTKRISQIKEGELVWGYDTNTNQPKIVPVIATRHQSRAGQWVKIKTTRNGLNKGNFFGTIHCTHDHKVWTKNRGYVEACQLTKEDILLSIRTDVIQPYQEVIKEQHIIDIEIDTKPRERWDIQTETHNFFTVGGLVHNTNIRVHWDGHKVEFGGRTDRAEIPKPLLEKLEELFSGHENEEIFEQKFGENEVILFGEGYGPKIQNGGLYRDDVSFILFDVQVGDLWLERKNVEDIAKTFNIDIVPIIFEDTLTKAIEYVKTNPDSIVAKNGAKMEGLVGRPKVELLDRRGNRLIVKVKWEDMKDLI